MRKMISLEGTMTEYLDGAEDQSRISPDALPLRPVFFRKRTK
ncbi:hypothetical protein [Pinibacter soli]|uniref:Uncharacterized protein n=1 Tax=Pinibacter soli TaxID=3044211 RepID=A0ABT6RIL7_9BACT|nr:hypothetical protein [Pinibacter soli]MDI3322230.1 hypothetical protein [Pinibacter soli]